jgi:hypothetical protein
MRDFRPMRRRPPTDAASCPRKRSNLRPALRGLCGRRKHQEARTRTGTPLPRQSSAPLRKPSPRQGEAAGTRENLDIDRPDGTCFAGEQRVLRDELGVLPNDTNDQPKKEDAAEPRTPTRHVLLERPRAHSTGKRWDALQVCVVPRVAGRQEKKDG